MTSEFGELPKISFAERMIRFWRWNGDGSPPQFSHWTSRGTVVLRAKTPGISSEVLFNGKFLGYDDIYPGRAASNLITGKYDETAGFPISEILPNLDEWNDLG